MAIAPYDPLAQAHQRELRFYAADVRQRINPSAPGSIPSNPLGGSGGTTAGGDGLGAREEGWRRSERYQNMAGNAFSSGGSGWQAFSGGGNGRRLQLGGSAQIDGANAPAARAATPKLDIPQNAGGFARQGAAFDYAANFQEHARDWSRSLGTRRG